MWRSGEGTLPEDQRYIGLRHQVESFLLFCESFDQAGPVADREGRHMEKRLGIVPGPFPESVSHEEQLIDLGKRVAQVVMVYGKLSPADRASLLDTMHELVDFLSQMLTFLDHLSEGAADELGKCGVLADKYRRPEEQLLDAGAGSVAVRFRGGFRDSPNAKNQKHAFDVELPLVLIPGNLFLWGRTADDRQVWRRWLENAERLTATG